MSMRHLTVSQARMRAAQIEREIERLRKAGEYQAHRAHLDRLRRAWLDYRDTLEQKHLRTLHSLRCWKSAPHEDNRDIELERVTLGLSGVCCDVGPSGMRRHRTKRDWRPRRDDL